MADDETNTRSEEHMKSQLNKGDQKKASGPIRRTRKPGFKSPDFDALGGMPMAVAFIFPDGKVGPLQGTCRGFGAISGTERPYETTIGIRRGRLPQHQS
jgi:hypothetical protein